MGRISRHDARLSVLHVAAVTTMLGGLFTTWAGAVRWQHCWGQVSCRTMGDEFWDGAFTGGVAPAGIQEPLLIGSASALMSAVVLAWSARRPVLAAFATVVVLCELVLVVHGTPARGGFPGLQDGTLTALSLPGGAAGMFGLLAALGLVGRFLARPERDALGTAAWDGVTGIGLTTSIWCWYVVPQFWADSWDDPTWMWSFDGTCTIAVGAALLWRAATLRARPDVRPPQTSVSEPSSVVTRMP